MTDLANAPDGATHYMNVNVLVFYKKVRGGWLSHCGHWEISGNSKAYNDANCKLIPCDSWTIYNNDKPLSELSDEQRGLLVNYWCNGGRAEFFDGDTWNDKGLSVNIINRKSIYRAKQKSERELFVDAALSATKPFSMDVGIAKAIAEDMFIAGFKAPKTDK